MAEANKYSPYESEEDLRKAMCIHEAGHVMAFYYVFNSLEDFDWVSVDLEECYKTNNKKGVETNYKKFPNLDKYKESKRDYSFDKYSFYSRWICVHLGGGFCQKHIENLCKLPEYGMTVDLERAKDPQNILAFQLHIDRFGVDDFEERKRVIYRNAEMYLDYLFSLPIVRYQAIQIASKLEEKSKFEVDKKVYSTDIMEIFECGKYGYE